MNINVTNMFDEIENGCSCEAKELVIKLAKSLGVDFPKDKTCKDCYEYKIGKNSFTGELEHRCWDSHKTTTRPCDPDDMNRCDYTDPYIIKNLEEAIDCPYYQSGFETYKRLYNESQEELKELKDSIRNLCGK